MRESAPRPTSGNMSEMNFLSGYKPDQVLFSVSEVASILGVSEQGVYKWIYAHKLPALRLGSQTLRVTRDALVNFAVEAFPRV